MSEPTAPALSRIAERILAAIGEFWATEGYGPSFRDLMEMTKLPTTSMIHYHLLKLRDVKLVAYDAGIPRSVRLVQAVGR